MTHSRVFMFCTRAVMMFAVMAFAIHLDAQIKFVFAGCDTPGPGAWVTTGDFNRDGKPDIAVSTDSGIQVCINQGSSKFVNTSTVTAVNPFILLTADLNHDGKLDLVTENFRASTLTYFFGNSDGTFRTGNTIKLSNPALEFVLGDFNKDGAIDIVALECDGASTCKLNEYLNSGTGTFPSKRQIMGSKADSGNCGFHLLLAADFDLDGKLDVVLCGAEQSSIIFFGHGDGSFGGPISIPPHSNLALGSFNHDRYPDIVGTTFPPCPNGPPCLAYAAVYLNDGHGHFGLRSRTLMAGAGHLATDVNGDGIQDVLSVRGGVFDAFIDYALGHGDGTFGSEVGISGDSTPTFPIARDINLDGRHDLVNTSAIDGGGIVLLNTNATVICTPPNAAALHAKICAPAAEAAVSTSFGVRASGNSPAGVQRLELWIDGKKRAEAPNDQMKITISVSLGTHRLAVVAVDLYGTRTIKAIQIHAQ